MFRLTLLLIVAVLAGCVSGRTDAPLPTVLVDAGPHDRAATPVSFDAPGITPGPYVLVDDAGGTIPVQVDADGRGWFVLERLPAGAQRTFRLVPDADAAPATAMVTAVDGAYAVAVDGAPVLTYRHAPVPPPAGVDPRFRRGGFVHPARTPSGAIVTDAYAPNHQHQQGIWSAWTNTRFEDRTPDFWNMGQGRGKVEPAGVDTFWSGPVQGGVRARHRFVDLTAPSPTPVLDEAWTLRVYDVDAVARSYRIFDLEVVQTTAGDAPLHLPEYHYGGVGLRGPWVWNGVENTAFLTSEGRTRADGHATRARWAHMGGLVDGRLAGITVLGHPDNFRAPQPMRIHPDEPFFNFAPTQLGAFSIEPGVPYRARYRYVTYDGEPDAALLDRLWNDYAEPPSVTLRR